MTAEPEKATDGKSANEAALVPLPHVPAKVSELMQDRNYAEAIKAIDEAAKAKDAPRDYLAYLKGRALQLSGQLDAAIEQFTAMEKAVSQERLGPPGTLWQGSGSGPQGRLSARPS